MASTPFLEVEIKMGEAFGLNPKKEASGIGMAWRLAL
jgi:hypothetical protein